MPVYQYEARNSRGELVKGEVPFDTEEEIRQYLSAKKLIPVKINTKNAFNTDINQLPMFKPKVKNKDIAFFCRQFSVMLDAGIAIGGVLDIIRKQSDNPTFKELIQEVYEEVQKGRSLSEALGDHNEFPPLLVSMVESGEVSGNLDTAMEQMATHYEKSVGVERKVKRAMVYPIIVIVFIIALLMGLLGFVVPKFFIMFRGAEANLPWITQSLITLSNFVTARWYVIFGIMFGLYFGCKLIVKNKKVRYLLDKLSLKLPMIGEVNKMVITSNFCRTLSTLMRAGTPIIQSMEVVRKVVENMIAKDIITNSIDEIKQGGSLAYSLQESNLFPMMLLNMIRVGEESGSLDYTMEETADYYEAEADVIIDQATTFILPAVLLLMGGIILYIMIAVFLPTFNLATQVM